MVQQAINTAEMASMIAVSNDSSNYCKHLEPSSEEQFLETTTADDFNNRENFDAEPHVHVFSEFPEMLISKLNDQRKCSSMCDVTIITSDGGSFRAHKAVLAATSRYLESELSSLNDEKFDSKSEAVIHLGMISSDSFETLLDLVYTAKLILTKQNVAEVLLAAEVLDLKRVGTICRKFLRSQITSKTVARGSIDSSCGLMHDGNNNEIRKNLHRPFDTCIEGREEPCLPISNIDKDNSLKVTSSPSDVTHNNKNDVEYASAVSSPEKTSSLSIDLNQNSINENQNEDISPSDTIPELLNATTLNSSERISQNTAIFCSVNDKNNLHMSDSSPYFKVKSEVKIVPEYFPQYQYPTAGVGKLPSAFSSYLKHGQSPSADEQKNDNSGSTEMMHNEEENQNCSEPRSASESAFYNFPFVSPSNRRSFDSTTGGSYNNNSFVDLNSTNVPARKKAKSDDHSLLQSTLYGQKDTSSSIHPLHRQYSDSPSFLASLYMLRSQALNPMNLLNSNYVGNSNILPFTRKQLQHSKSIVSSTGLLCKFCRLEFTSEWSLSIHYNLCHPINYFSRQPPTPQPNQSLYDDTTEQQNVGNMRAKPLLLTRSTSSSANVDTRLSKDFGNTNEYSAFDMRKDKTIHKCYHCKKEFASIYLLRKHKSTEHMKRPFRCHRCNSAFPNKAGLSVHLRSHTGERPYKCKVCHKAFTQLGHVQRHQKVHTGEKPYECPYCQARVRDKASMNYHILAHQGVKPFQCDKCDARFTKRSSLVKHKNVHTGSFLYQCPQCKASFREKASLSRHVRNQHKEPHFSVSTDCIATNANGENNISIDLSKKSKNVPAVLNSPQKKSQ